MAAFSQVSQNKRGRDEYWNGGLASPDAKRSNSGFTLALDSDLMAFLDKIDNVHNNPSNQEETDIAVSELESEIRQNGVIESLEDETGLQACQAENIIESNYEKGSADEMGSLKQGELTADGSNSEATSVCDVADHLTYYDDVHAELDFFAGNYLSPNDLGIIIDNYVDGDSMPNSMYLDAVHGYPEATEDFYGSLWDHDKWQLNEHSLIQNIESPNQENVGLGTK